MLRFFSVGFSQFLLFSAMVLMILTNIGQLTTNIVARNISIARLNMLNSDGLTKAASAASSVLGLGDGNRGPPKQIKWGLYNHCAYFGGKIPTCSPRGFGQEFDPVKAVTTDMGMNFSKGTDSFFEKDNRVSNLHEKSTAAFYLLFVGTILAGVAFLITCLIHMSALVIAAFFAFLAFALIAAGASIWTYMVYEFRDIASASFRFDYGNALWFCWASVGCTLFALPALAGGSAASRRRYYEEPYY